MVWYEEPIVTSLQYNRHARLGLSEIPTVVEGRISFPNGISINAKSSRMQLLWLRKELVCEFCGISAGFAAIETCKGQPDSYHLNFYGYDHNGEEVQLTWDHVVPKSQGGNNQQANAQCLCRTCNELKGADKGKVEVTKLRKQKGMPIWYTYHADGSVKYKWSKHQFTSTLNGEAQSTKNGGIK